MVLTGSLRRRVAISNRRRLRASRCGRRNKASCKRNARCTWHKGKTRSFCRRVGNRRTRRFRRRSIFGRR